MIFDFSDKYQFYSLNKHNKSSPEAYINLYKVFTKCQ